MRAWKTTAAGAGVAFALAVLASGVLAGQKLTTASDNVTVAGDTYASATATCERGTKAVSGGFQMQDYFFDIMESSGSGGKKWTSEGPNFSGEENTLTSFAYCRDEDVKRRTASTLVNPTSFAASE